MGVPIPVDPTVFVERAPNHTSCTWQAEGLASFLAAVRAASDETDPVVAVDATSTAGRRRVPLSRLDPTDDVRYVRFDPPDAYRVAWERRTTPVVSLDGSAVFDPCRRFHRATTDCDEWPDDARARLADLADDTDSFE